MTQTLQCFLVQSVESTSHSLNRQQRHSRSRPTEFIVTSSSLTLSFAFNHCMALNSLYVLMCRMLMCR